jgi:hypothetical protein
MGFSLVKHNLIHYFRDNFFQLQLLGCSYVGLIKIGDENKRGTI